MLLILTPCVLFALLAWWLHRGWKERRRAEAGDA